MEIPEIALSVQQPWAWAITDSGVAVDVQDNGISRRGGIMQSVSPVLVVDVVKDPLQRKTPACDRGSCSGLWLLSTN